MGIEALRQAERLTSLWISVGERKESDKLGQTRTYSDGVGQGQTESDGVRHGQTQGGTTGASGRRKDW